MAVYDHKAIERRWRQRWLKERVYQPRLVLSRGKPRLKNRDKKYYNLMMFPYPSAEGLHVGNMYAFTGSDVWGRYQRMRGKDVFEPIGLDGFGIHSENYAIQIGKHPAEQAKVSEKRFYDQLLKIGNGFAWEQRLETYDPDYYRWTQWLFIQMFKHDLAYRKKAMVNWCPSCKTVLADEQVEGGVCERCKTEVRRKPMEQWFFRITKYADRLLANIEEIDWPEKIKAAQRNWIGRKEGINITYPIKGSQERVSCFTTRPDTNFGATFVVLAPEYGLVKKILEGEFKIPDKTKEKVGRYVGKALKKTEQQRLEEGRKKTGVFTGLYAVNQLNDYEMPIYVSDFVLMGVGTGAVVGVPGHDRRDFEFAQEFNLEVKRVVVASDGDKSPITKIEQVQEEEGMMVNSEFLNGMEIRKAIGAMMDHIEKQGWGKREVTYHLRDWLISRQRYWGPPIPMVRCDKCGWQPVAEKDLPVKLPFVKDYKPTGDGRSPLGKASKEWLYTKCPECGGRAKRETDVSDTFLDSSWYFLRYPSIGKVNAQASAPWNPEVTRRWLPVDAYIGGAEHAVLHLLYSRFVTMALKDWGYLEFEEPFPFLYSHGLIIKDGAKMSKSRGNIVIPDDYIDKYGADTLRVYLMFLGDYSNGGDFRDTGIAAMYRFLMRVWALYTASNGKIGEQSTSDMARRVARCARQVTERIERFKYNTAIAALMELMGAWKEEGAVLSRQDAVTVLKLLAPFAPYMTEELYQRLYKGNTKFKSIHLETWPEWDEKLLKKERVTVVVQVNGRVRGTLQIANDKLQTADVKEEIIKLAKEDERVKKWIANEEVKKAVWVEPRKGRQGLVNLVVQKS